MSEKYAPTIETIIDLLRNAGNEISNAEMPPQLLPLAAETFEDLDDLAERWRHNLDHMRQLGGAEDTPDDTRILGKDYPVEISVQHVLDRNRRKWNGPSRNRKKKGICLHHTAIAGGMRGPSKVPPGWPERVRDFKHGLLKTDTLIRLAYRVAGQGPRYTGQSYHVWSTRLSGGLIFNLPFDFRTWHGDGANDDFLGYAIDYHSGKDSLWDLQLERIKLTRTVARARDEGHPIEELTVHGAWANKPIDPGAEVIREIMEPVAAGVGLTIDYDFKRPGCTSIGEMLEV